MKLFKSKVKRQKPRLFRSKVKSQRLVVFFTFHFLLFTLAPYGQSGAPYEIKKSVVSNGGGKSDGETYSITGTAAQAAVGVNSTGGTFSVRGGFWQPSFAPTAAGVSVTGIAVDSRGRGISKARISVTDQRGNTRSVFTNTFGYFNFEDVEAGQSYAISVRSKQYQFTNPTQVIFVGDSISDLIFSAFPEGQIK